MADELSKKRATKKPANDDERRIIIIYQQQQEHEVNSTMNYETWQTLRNNKEEEIMVWNETVPSAPKRLGRIESGKTEKVLSKMCGFTDRLENGIQL